MSLEAETNVGLVSSLSYADADAAVDWLCRAFGFDPHAVYRDEQGHVIHAQLTFGGGMIMIGPAGAGEFGKWFKTMPADAGGRCTQSIYGVVRDADAHHARAVAAGAAIVMPLEDAPYGGRGYSARDPEGHVWSFGSYDPWHAEG